MSNLPTTPTGQVPSELASSKTESNNSSAPNASEARPSEARPSEARPTRARLASQAMLRSQKICEDHLRRLAIVYVRQSDPKQVLNHPESTDRQYALKERAIDLGWPSSAVEVIDEDQGRSGATAEGRNGFQHLLAEVSCDRVGLILSTEMSRLARSCKDWHALLEVCAIYRTLLADADGIYDPSNSNDRLLLGLKGTMSEAELVTLKNRLQEARWNKAERGDLLNHPPLGYVRTAAGDDYVIDPDEQAQAVVRMIFEQFPRQGSVNGLLRWLIRHGVKLPIRPLHGENRGNLEWRRPNRATLLNTLHHPIYAGAYRQGHRETDPRKKIPGRPGTGRTFNPYDKCRVLIQDRFSSYISWEEFLQNQDRLEENSRLGKMLSAPRHGPSLLAGLVVCGRCGYHMLVAYANVSSKTSLRYSCQRAAIEYGEAACQNLAGAVVESLVTEQLLKAISPASLELSLAASEDIEQERKELDEHWQQRLTRSRYEVEQARRQYDAVDCEHRLVACELERRWEEALRAEEQLQADYARWKRDSPAELSPTEREQIEALSKDLPALWHAESTTPEDRQRIARILLEQVTLTVLGETEKVEVELRFAGGFQTQHTLIRPVQTYQQLSNYEQLVARIDELRAKGKTLTQVAEVLNTEGFHPPKRVLKFNQGILSCFLRDRQIRQGQTPAGGTSKEHLKANEWWLSDLAVELKMPLATIHRWRKVGWLSSRKLSIAGGRWAIFADEEELTRLRQLRDAPRSWPRTYPENLTTPKPQPYETE